MTRTAMILIAAMLFTAAIWVLAIVGIACITTGPAEAGARSPRAHVTTIRDELGGRVGDWRGRVHDAVRDGEIYCLQGTISSAATLTLELHRYGLLAISPDASIGVHAVRVRIDPFVQQQGFYEIAGHEAAHIAAARAIFYAAYAQFPGLWDAYAGNGCTTEGCAPILRRSMSFVAGSWFNARGVPEC